MHSKIDLTQSHDVLGVYKQIDFSNVKNRCQDFATKYCFDVLDKRIITGYLIQLACFRHLRDLQRQGSEDFPYRYSEKRVNDILKFASICPNVDTGEPTELMDWQKFVFAMLLGWRNAEGGKRFSRAIVSVARG